MSLCTGARISTHFREFLFAALLKVHLERWRVEGDALISANFYSRLY